MHNKLYLPFLALLVLFTTSCEEALPNKGVEFDAEMLVLTPGSTTASLNIAWYSSDTSGEKSLVRLFNDKNKLIKTVEGKSGAASKGKRYHKATLDNLTTGAKHKYSVSNDEINWSAEYDYTVPAVGAFKFAAIADPQLTVDANIAKSWEENIEKIFEAEANFIVGAGDHVDSYEEKENEYANLLAPAMGNHDAHSRLMKTVYLTLNTASGLKYYDVSDADLPSSVTKYSQNKTPEYTIVDISNANMAVKTYGVDGTLIDEFVIGN